MTRLNTTKKTIKSYYNLFNTYVDTVYPKKAPTLKNIEHLLKKIMSHEIDDVNQVPVSTENTIMQSLKTQVNMLTKQILETLIILEKKMIAEMMMEKQSLKLM